MSRRFQTTLRRSGLVLSGFLAHFVSIIVGFKAQTQEIEGRTICDIFWSFFEGEKPSLRVETP